VASRRRAKGVAHTTAWLTLEANLDAVIHLLAFQTREIRSLETSARRIATKPMPDLSVRSKSGVDFTRSLRKFSRRVGTAADRLNATRLWLSVMLVTCVETYLQDVLGAAARHDPALIRTSELTFTGPAIMDAASLDQLKDAVCDRWARSWLRGGPSDWMARLHKMGARGFGKDLGARLERLWGIRHVVVHSAGVATPEFVRRHPDLRVTTGSHVPMSLPDFQVYLIAAMGLVEPAESMFLARYPALASGS
jgi:hypothetical protein